ncbi:MAG: hypothetical protein V3R34_01705 [Hyphomicrobium sp.]
MVRVLGGGGEIAPGLMLPADLRIIGNTLCSKMINKSGGPLAVGEYVVPGSTDLGVNLGSAPSRRALGTVAEPSLADGDDVWITGTRFPVLCTSGAVAVGDFLEGVGSLGRARDVSFGFPGVFGIAVTSKTGGSGGIVQAMVPIAELF